MLQLSDIIPHLRPNRNAAVQHINNTSTTHQQHINNTSTTHQHQTCGLLRPIKIYINTIIFLCAEMLSGGLYCNELASHWLESSDSNIIKSNAASHIYVVITTLDDHLCGFSMNIVTGLSPEIRLRTSIELLIYPVLPLHPPLHP